MVSSVDKKLDVKPRFLEIFQEENYPTEYPYKSKVILTAFNYFCISSIKILSARNYSNLSAFRSQMILNTKSCIKPFNDKNGYEDVLYVNLIMSLEIFNDFFCHYMKDLELIVVKSGCSYFVLFLGGRAD